MKGVHLYVVCEDGTQDRIKTALKRIDLPRGTIISKDDNQPLILFGQYGYRYDSVCMLDINYWAFRGVGKAQSADIKLPLGHILRQTYSWAVADYSLNPANDIYLKDTWVSMSRPLRLTGSDSPSRKSPDHNHRDGVLPTRRKLLAGALIEASERAHWLHDANRAVYGEDYKKQNRNISAHFLNETEPNWHLDASILHYSADEVNNYFSEWAPRLAAPRHGAAHRTLAAQDSAARP